MYTNLSIQNIGLIEARAFLDLKSTPVIIALRSSDSADADGVMAWSEITMHIENRALAAALVKAINAAVAECAAPEPAPDMSGEEFSDVTQF